MATIRERVRNDGTRVYNVQVRLKGFPDRTGTFSTRRNAERWARQIEGEMEDGRHFRTAEAKRRTLGEAVHRYLLEEVPKKKDGEMHTTTLRWWRVELGHLKLAEVTTATVVEKRGELQRKTHRGRLLSGARVNRYLACLSHLFTVARREWHWASFNPLEDVSKLPEGKGVVRWASDDERAALFTETAKDPTLHTFVLVALSTVCRAGELQKLEWPDIDLKGGRLLFRDPKNGQARAVPLHGVALEALKALGRVRQLHNDRVFVNPSGRGTRYDYSKRFRAAVNAAGIKKFRFHDLRHSGATYLAQDGATEQQLRAIGGWKSNVVSRYVHLAAEDARGALQRLAEKIRT